MIDAHNIIPPPDIAIQTLSEITTFLNKKAMSDDKCINDYYLNGNDFVDTEKNENELLDFVNTMNCHNLV